MHVLPGRISQLVAGRFVLRHRFGLIDAFHCCLVVVPAGLLLLIIDYVIHDGRLLSVFLLILCGVLAFSSAVVDFAHA